MQLLSKSHSPLPQTDPKALKKVREILNSQNNLDKEEHSGELLTSWFQNFLQSYSNQDSVLLGIKINVEINRSENPERNPHTYDQFIYGTKKNG